MRPLHYPRSSQKIFQQIIKNILSVKALPSETENTLTAAPSLPPRCRAPPGSWHSRYRCSGAPSVAEEPRPNPYRRYACLQAALPDPTQALPRCSPGPAPLPPRAGRLVLYSCGAYRGHCGKAVEDSQIIHVSAGKWVGWTIWVNCPVGAAVAFGGDALLQAEGGNT